LTSGFYCFQTSKEPAQQEEKMAVDEAGEPSAKVPAKVNLQMSTHHTFSMDHV